MSCIIMDYKKVAQLADFLAALNDHGFNYFGFDCDYDLSRILTDYRHDGQINKHRVFEMLVRHNHLAYDSVYSEHRTITPIPDMPTVQTLYNPRSCYPVDMGDGKTDLRTVIEPWHYTLFKYLECYLYQICEDATKNSALYKAIDQQINIIGGFIVRNQIDYVKAEWGVIDVFVWKMSGSYQHNGKLFCYVECDTMDDAFRIARSTFGEQTITGAQPLANDESIDETLPYFTQKGD